LTANLPLIHHLFTTFTTCCPAPPQRQ
jgi:hypothetical protein